MMSSGATATRSKFPFTATQWQELEHQALVYKYMISGMPIPPDLLFTIKRSLDSSSPSSKLLLHHPPHSTAVWNCFQMGFGRKIDPEPGRCRRTDGKKWRCSKEAYPDSKYCERHMHRGRNRSRKPVEVNLSTTTPTPPTSSSATTNNHTPPPTIPISSITKSPNYPSFTLSSDSHHLHNHNHNHISYTNNNNNSPFLYSNSPSSRSLGFPNLSPQDPFLLESGSNYSHPDKDYRSSSYGHGMKDEVDEHPFFSEISGSTRSHVSDSWHLEPLTMGSSKQRTCSDIQNGYSYLQHQGLSNNRQQKQDEQHYYHDMGLKMERDQDEPQKVMHHFFDEWPHKNNDSSTTQLSISMPVSSHDFFMTTHNDK